MSFQYFHDQVDAAFVALKERLSLIYANTVTSPDEERQKQFNYIRAELEKGFDRTLSHLEIRRVELSPFARLPPEIICEIVSCSASKLNDYIHLSHINSTWRYTIVGNPRYWNYFDFKRSKSCTDTLLQRSGQVVGLQLCITSPLGKRPEVLEFNPQITSILKSQSHRIETLDVDLPILASVTGGATNSKVLDLSYPSLRQLRMSHEGNLRQLGISFNDPERYTRFILALHTFTSLQQLAVYAVDVWEDVDVRSVKGFPDRPVLPGLKSLVLAGQREWRSIQKYFYFPALQYLDIPIHERTWGQWKGQPYNISDVGATIECFDFSPIQYLHLGIHAGRPFGNKHHCIIGSTERDLTDIIARQRSIPIRNHNNNYNFTDDIMFPKLDGNNSKFFHIKFSPYDSVVRNDISFPLLRNLPLTDLREISINLGYASQFESFSQDWQRIISRAGDRLEKLTIISHYAISVRNFLIIAPETSSCPSLSSFTVEFLIQNDYNEVRSSLISFFNSRRNKVEFPDTIWRLELVNCYGDEEEAAKDFKDLVNHFSMRRDILSMY
ncbi:hypothetical protein Clacol_000804 [Clathrus columnatus]|uniref:F-box domain-containing protein n=1 Tax=Clathrus columnatus TaxID=1419009 RepID=A0AAV5A0Q9_9AGAM|nr:hypothetical protein Clacol_000804 [Clathrus columnatus]